MIHIIKKVAKDFKTKLVSKSGSSRSKEIRYHQRLTIDQFVDEVIKTIEKSKAKY